MINLDSLTLKAFLRENKDFFLNSRVQKIQMPTKRELILHLRNHNKSEKFYININPQYAHVCFINKVNEQLRNIAIPQKPPMFCMLLRKHLEGSRISGVNKIDFERVLEIDFQTYNEVGEESILTVAIELMGKHSNVVLYRKDTGVILGCAHNISSEKSKERELFGGLIYMYPPIQTKKDILKTTFLEFLDVLSLDDDPIEKVVSKNFYYLSNPLVCEIYNYEPDKKKFFEELQKIVALRIINPSISKNYAEFSIYGKDEELYEKKHSVNTMLDDYFSHNVNEILVTSMRKEILNVIKFNENKLQKLKSKQEEQLEKIKNANTYKYKAEIIMSNLYDEELIDSTDVELDKTKTLIENANRYYKLYGKFKTASRVAEDMLKKTIEQLEELEDLKFSTDIADCAQDFLALKQELSAPKNKKVVTEKQIVQSMDIDGFRVFVGKTSKQNDYLLKEIAKGDDLWFHVLNIPSAHLILKVEKKKVVESETIERVAKLVKLYSKARASKKASVIYTQKKFVKKPPNSPAGFVIYKNEKEIVVE